MAKKDFKCALSSRAGRTILLGDGQIEVGHDGIARGLSGAARAYCERQPQMWVPLDADDKESESPRSTAGRKSLPHPVDGIAPHKPKPSAVILPKKTAQVQLPSRDAKVVLPRRGGRKSKKGAP